MLTLILPFSMEALQGAVRRYLSRPSVSIEEVVPQVLEDHAPGGYACYLNVLYRSDAAGPNRGRSSMLSLLLKPSSGQAAAHTCKILAPDDIVGELTAPLVVTADGASPGQWDNGDWVLVEDTGTRWTAGRYHAALAQMAAQHAKHWDSPVFAGEPVRHSKQNSDCMVEEAHAALMQIDAASWGSKFLPKAQVAAWLRVLDRPGVLLDLLVEMPQTLIQADCPLPGGSFFPAVPGGAQELVTGSAVYDLARFYTMARWLFGRLPLSLVDMRNLYLHELNARLERSVDRYAFDSGIDAARAWHFALYWLPFIAEQHSTLLACRHHLSASVIEPAFAALRRSTQ